MYKVLGEYRRGEIEGAESAQPFVRLSDGTVLHLASLVTEPSRSSLSGPDLVYYDGDFPEYIARAAEADQPSLIRVFVEVEANRVIYLGFGRFVALRLGRSKMLGLHTEVPLPEQWIAKVAPALLNQRQPVPVSVDIFVEITRSGAEWNAVVDGLGVKARERSFLAALSSAGTAAANMVIGTLAEDREIQGLRPLKTATDWPGKELSLPTPKTEGLRSVKAGLDWPMDSIAVSPRVVVRVNVFSADLSIPGWCLMREECWF